MKKILIVDNETSILIAFSKIMQSPDTEVHTAETMLEAMNLLNQHEYRLVLCDLRLTGIENAEGMAILRYARQRCPMMVTALMTAYGSDDIREKADDYGIDYYMEKPVQPRLLRELVAAAHTGAVPRTNRAAG